MRYTAVCILYIEPKMVYQMWKYFHKRIDLEQTSYFFFPSQIILTANLATYLKTTDAKLKINKLLIEDKI